MSAELQVWQTQKNAAIWQAWEEGQTQLKKKYPRRKDSGSGDYVRKEEKNNAAPLPVEPLIESEAQLADLLQKHDWGKKDLLIYRKPGGKVYCLLAHPGPKPLASFPAF
jgi:hypothetical protein